MFSKKWRKWVAGETWISNLSYERKKEIIGNDKFNLKGLEFYIGGIFELKNDSASPKSKSALNSCFIGNYDWKEKHSANQPYSQYYDGDTDGGGWFTSIKNQWCGNCWAYAAVGETEVITNLYYNRHIDFDLSEAEVTYCTGGSNGCDGGWVSNGLRYIKDNGIVEENCFPTPSDNFQHYCSEKCLNPTEKLGFATFTRNDAVAEDSLKKMIIKTSLAAIIDVPYLFHAMVLCGYHQICVNDSIYYCSETSNGWIVFSAGDPMIGKTYWIFKNSWGPDFGNNGYLYMIIDDVESVISQTNQICAVVPPLTTLNYSGNNIRCSDFDGDGYYNWGIGSKPSTCPTCPNLEDGDDSNSNLGPINIYGFCAHLIRNSQTWQSVNNEYADVIVKNGGNLTLNGATINLANNSSFVVEIGGSLIFNSGTIQ